MRSDPYGPKRPFLRQNKLRVKHLQPSSNFTPKKKKKNSQFQSNKKLKKPTFFKFSTPPSHCSLTQQRKNLEKPLKHGKHETLIAPQTTQRSSKTSTGGSRSAGKRFLVENFSRIFSFMCEELEDQRNFEAEKENPRCTRKGLN